MNEPACFNNNESTMSKSNIHHVNLRSDEPIKVEHREIHSVYGYFNTLATSQGLLTRNEG